MTPMNIRLMLSRLATAEARQNAARGLALVCAAGFVLSLFVLFATGVGLRRWLFVLLSWTLFAYLPLRILLEAFQTIAPGIRRTLISQTSAKPDRYRDPQSIELTVDGLFERNVLMPRIATPIQTAKAKEGSTTVLARISKDARADLKMGVMHALGAVERWITDLAVWSSRDAPENIQARWADLRALAALAALTRVLVASHRDLFDAAPLAPGVTTERADDYLESCLDYCDRLALEEDVVPWTEPALNLPVTAERAAGIRVAWMEYSATAPPALEARNAFVRALLYDDTGGRQ